MTSDRLEWQPTPLPFAMKEKEKKNLEQLKAELRELSREEMRKINSARTDVRFNPRWERRCEGKMPQ